MKCDKCRFDNILCSEKDNNGKEFFFYRKGPRLEGEEGYTIIKDQGVFKYAVLENDQLKPSDIVYGDIENLKKINIEKHLQPKTVSHIFSTPKYHNHELEQESKLIQQNAINNRKKIFNSGETFTVNVINIYIGFLDTDDNWVKTQTSTSLTNSSRNDYENIFGNENSFNSLKHYFNEISHGKCNVVSHFYPKPANYISESGYRYYKAPQNRSYYSDFDIGSETQNLLNDAVNHVKSEIQNEFQSPGNEMDYDNDNYIDAFSFIVQGNVGSWSSFFWPHKWSLYQYQNYIHNKRVYTYQFMLADSGYYSPSVLCHEFGHVLGAPDLYHYEDNDTPVGQICIMASNTNPMQYACNYIRCKYWGFIYPNGLEDIPVINSDSTNGDNKSILNVTNSDNTTDTIFKWSPTGNYTSDEYYVIEYRKGKSNNYDNSNYIPSNGAILVFRINPNSSGNAGSDLYTDEIYVFRSNGTFNNHYTNINFYTSSITDEISVNSEGEPTNPALFLVNNNGDNLTGILRIEDGDNDDQKKIYMFETSCEEIKEELEQQITVLQSEKAALQSENDTLQSENDTLQSANDTLKSENDTLQSEKAALQSENDTLQSANDTLQSANDTLQSANNTLQSANNTLQSANDTLKSENDTLKSEKAALQSENDTLKSENDTLKSENDTLQSENDTLKSENDTLKSENDTLQSEKSALQSENDTIKLENIVLTNANTKLDSNNSNLEIENEKIEKDKQKCNSEKNEVEKKRKTIRNLLIGSAIINITIIGLYIKNRK